MAVTVYPQKQTLVISQRTAGGRPRGSWRPLSVRGCPASVEEAAWAQPLLDTALGTLRGSRLSKLRFRCALSCRGTLAHGFAQVDSVQSLHHSFPRCATPCTLRCPCSCLNLQEGGRWGTAVQAARLLWAFCGLRTTPVGPGGGPQCRPPPP